MTGEVEVGWGWREKVGRRPAEYYNRREPQKSAAPPGNVIPINVTRHSEPWGHHASMVSRLPYSANLGYYKYWLMAPPDEVDWDDEEVLNRARLYRDRRDFVIQDGDSGIPEQYPSGPAHSL